MTTDAADSDTPPAPVAAIDVGSNTIRLLVARVLEGRVEPLARGAAMTALGAGLRPGGRIGEDGLDAVEATARQMAAEARNLGARVLAVACTAVARDAANADELLARLERATGVPARVLSGPDEAALTFRGLVSAGAPDPLLAVNLGGRSMEVVSGRGGRLRWATSLPVGARSLTERFAPGDPPALDLVEPMTAVARELVDPVVDDQGRSEAVAAGGSAVALAALAGSERLDRDALVRAVERLAATPSADLAEETGVPATRVRLSLAGAAILEAVRRAFALDALLVSRAGLREGLVLEAAAG